MIKQFEVVRKLRGEYVSRIYEVHYELGQCEDQGDYPYRPKSYGPAGVVYVFDEDSNDVTAWALEIIGETTLIDKAYIELKRKRKRITKPIYRWPTQTA